MRAVPPHHRAIRAILAIAAIHQHRVVVLGAFGCGAFRNPPYHVACLFAQVACGLQMIISLVFLPHVGACEICALYMMKIGVHLNAPIAGAIRVHGYL